MSVGSEPGLTAARSPWLGGVQPLIAMSKGLLPSGSGRTAAAWGWGFGKFVPHVSCKFHPQERLLKQTHLCLWTQKFGSETLLLGRRKDC